MTELTLDSELLKRLILEEGGGVEALRNRWYEVYCHATRTPPRLPDRATFYRWQSGKLPGNRNQFLRLCGLLDVDPFAILALPKGQEAVAIQRLRGLFWQKDWGHRNTLGLLSEFFGHHVNWPPPTISTDYFKKSWALQEFSYDPNIKSDFYAGIEIKGDARVYDKRPQVFHFAYSQPDTYAQRWIQYGYVARHSNLVTLMNITGEVQSYEAPIANHLIIVETWFGQEPADFRVASLHSFSLSVQYEGKNDGMKVRF